MKLPFSASPLRSSQWHWAPAARTLLALLLILSAALATAAPLQGKVSGTDGKPLAHCFVAALDPGFAPIANTTTGADGSFSLPDTPREGFLVVQPAPVSGDRDVQVHPYHPRLFVLGDDERNLDLRLPPAYTLVLEAYDGAGKLVRWEDFEQRGRMGGQFVYATDLDDVSIPMTVWPAHGVSLTGIGGGPREAGAPAVLVEPGASFAINVLFWPLPEYGKLMLRADNAGQGFRADPAGGSRVVLLNHELARTAIADLQRRAPHFPAEARAQIQALQERLTRAATETDRKALAHACDALLAEALELRDELEFALAKTRIPEVRQGTITVQLDAPPETTLAGWKVEVKQQRHGFLFGVFEGSPYNAAAFEAARKGGFELATVLLGWNWTESPKSRQRDIDMVFGLKMLQQLGYTTKAHGVVWMQAPPILPDKAMGMAHEELTRAALAHQEALLEAFGDEVGIWEAINEPANTNVVQLSGAAMMDLMAEAAATIRAKDKPVLVNSPHEFSYGAKYIFHRTDNQPVDGYPRTFSEFLAQAQTQGKLEDIGIIGLQFYPGLHFNEEWGNLQGPCYTPAYLLDTLERYTRFGKTLHITEFSIPSAYQRGAFNGFWREEWNEATQADYAERVYTLAFAHSQVQSIGWWDIVDDKSSVISGGLIRRGGAPKPIFERLTGLIRDWSTDAEITTDAGGTASIPAFGGDYEIIATAPNGKTYSERVHLLERWHATVTLQVK